MVVPHDDQSPFGQMRWVEVKNTSGADLDAFSVVENAGQPEVATTPEGRLVHQVGPPSQDSQGDLFVLGPMGIKAGQLGVATDANLVLAKISGSPGVGDQIGSVAGSTALTTGQRGWFYAGDVTVPSGLTVGRVMRGAGGGVGGTIKIRFTIASGSGASVVANITARPCGVASVPLESSSQVTVYDPCGCFFNEPAADLVGRCGTAWYAEPTGQDCQWEVDSLCCPSC